MKDNFFKKLTKEEMRNILSYGRRMLFKPGRLLFRQQALHGGVFIIESGCVRTYFTARDGRELTLAYWSAGNLVGGPDIYEKTKHIWSGVAVEPTQVIYLSGNQVGEIIHKIPGFSLAIIDALVVKGRYFSKLSQLLGTRNAVERLAIILLDLAAVDEHPLAGRIEIERRYTHDELASMIGTTRQWVTVTLGKFRDAGLVDFDRNMIAIIDIEGLRAYQNR